MKQSRSPGIICMYVPLFLYSPNLKGEMVEKIEGSCFNNLHLTVYAYRFLFLYKVDVTFQLFNLTEQCWGLLIKCNLPCHLLENKITFILVVPRNFKQYL